MANKTKIGKHSIRSSTFMLRETIPSLTQRLKSWSNFQFTFCAVELCGEDPLDEELRINL